MSFIPLLPYIGSAISGILLSESVRYMFSDTTVENTNEIIADISTTPPPKSNFLNDIKLFDKNTLQNIPKIQENVYNPKDHFMTELKQKLNEKRKHLEYNM